MSKQNQAAESQQEKPTHQKNRLAVVTEQAEGQVSVTELARGLMTATGDSSGQAQAARLSDRRFLTAQRQAMVAHIGRVGGNHYLQRVMAQMKDHGQKADGKDALTAQELTPVVQQRGGQIQPLLQREEENDPGEEEKTFEFERKVVLIPIELKDKDSKRLLSQSASLELSLDIKVPLKTNVGKINFSFLQPEISAALKAAYEHKSGAKPEIKAELEGGISVTIAEAKLKGNLFLPKSSAVKFVVEGQLGWSIGTKEVDLELKPKIKLEIPLTKKGASLQIWGTPPIGGLPAAGGIGVEFTF